MNSSSRASSFAILDATPIDQSECEPHDLGELHEVPEFLRSMVDSLSVNISVLDDKGVIRLVNQAWRNFALENQYGGQSAGLGTNYLDLCTTAVGSCSDEAPTVARGIRDVLMGKTGEFRTEYPCHSPEEERWFVVRVTRFNFDNRVWLVVAHENVTVVWLENQ